LEDENTGFGGGLSGISGRRIWDGIKILVIILRSGMVWKKAADKKKKRDGRRMRRSLNDGIGREKWKFLYPRHAA
jgi:hypothetical protein